MLLDILYWVAFIYGVIGVAMVIYVVVSLLIGSLKVEVLFKNKKRGRVANYAALIFALILLALLWPLTFKAVDK